MIVDEGYRMLTQRQEPGSSYASAALDAISSR